jgi:hypothetical protein
MYTELLDTCFTTKSHNTWTPIQPCANASKTMSKMESGHKHISTPPYFVHPDLDGNFFSFKIYDPTKVVNRYQNILCHQAHNLEQSTTLKYM